LGGFDPSLPDVVQDIQGIPLNQRDPGWRKLQSRLGIAIRGQFPLYRIAFDLSIFGEDHDYAAKWIVGVRGVGGAVDVVTNTRT